MVAIRQPPSAVLWRLLNQVRRLGWGVADQAVSSVTNAVMVLYVAHTVRDAAAFGAFSLAYVTYSFALNASRGLTSDPLVVRFSYTDPQTWRRAVASCTGTATVAGLAVGACVLAVAALLGRTAGSAFVGLGLTLPVLLLQDSWRFAFFAIGRGSQAFLNDLIWAVALIPALILLRAAHTRNVFWFMFAWGAAAGVAAVAGLVQARVTPRPSGSWGWLSRHRDLGLRYFAENLSNSLSGQLRTYGLGGIAGLAAVGYVQAAGTLMGPVLVLVMGMSIVGIPEAARILHRSVQHLRRFCVLLSGGLAVVAVAWGAVLLVALPRGLGTLLVGPIWRPMYPVILPYAFALTAVCIWCGATAGLHALGAARRSLRAMVLASTASLAGGLLGALEGGAVGSVRGLAVTSWIGALVWWWQLHAAIQESGLVPVGHQTPATEPPRRETSPGLAASATVSQAVNGANGQREQARLPEPFVTVPAARKSGAPVSGPASLPAQQDWSASPSPPATPEPSFTPTSWTAVVTSDPAYYDRMRLSSALSGTSGMLPGPFIVFPIFSDDRRFRLTGNQMRIGRRSATRDLELEIDLAGPAADPGVSRLHAILIAAPDGTWALLDPGSANGTLLNGRKIAIGDLVPLHDGDRINLGAWTVITVHRG